MGARAKRRYEFFQYAVAMKAKQPVEKAADTFIHGWPRAKRQGGTLKHELASRVSE